MKTLLSASRKPHNNPSRRCLFRSFEAKCCCSRPVSGIISERVSTHGRRCVAQGLVLLVLTSCEPWSRFAQTVCIPLWEMFPFSGVARSRPQKTKLSRPCIPLAADSFLHNSLFTSFASRVGDKGGADLLYTPDRSPLVERPSSRMNAGAVPSRIQMW